MASAISAAPAEQIHFDCIFSTSGNRKKEMKKYWNATFEVNEEEEEENEGKYSSSLRCFYPTEYLTTLLCEWNEKEWICLLVFFSLFRIPVEFFIFSKAKTYPISVFREKKTKKIKIKWNENRDSYV